MPASSSCSNTFKALAYPIPNRLCRSEVDALWEITTIRAADAKRGSISSDSLSIDGVDNRSPQSGQNMASSGLVALQLLQILDMSECVNCFFFPIFLCRI